MEVMLLERLGSDGSVEREGVHTLMYRETRKPCGSDDLSSLFNTWE